MNKHEIIRSKIRTIPDFPKPGIMFRDITTLLQDAEGFTALVDVMTERYAKMDIDFVAGIEARGFIIGGILAYKLGKGFIPIRKSGKLPHHTISHEYNLEYGTDTIEVHVDSIQKGERVLILDDLLATGGTSLAAAILLEKLGAKVVELGFIVDLPDLGGSRRIKGAGYDIFTICEFEGE